MKLTRPSPHHYPTMFCCLLAPLFVLHTLNITPYLATESPQMAPLPPVQPKATPNQIDNRVLAIFLPLTPHSYISTGSRISTIQNITLNNSNTQNNSDPIVITPQNYQAQSHTTPILNGTDIANQTASNNTTNDGQVAQNEQLTAPKQLDYSLMGLMSNDDKTLSFCNSSWAIAAAYLYEHNLIQRGITISTSEQAIISCSSFYSVQDRINDCSGGFFEDALRFLALVGTVPKKAYPKTSSNLASLSSRATICTDKNRIFVGEGEVVVVSNASNDQIKQLLYKNGPLLVMLYADKEFVQYSSGTFSACPSTIAAVNFTAVLFGYSGNDYWLIRAPFGQKWGYMGSMRLQMSNNCGLNKRLGYIRYSSFETESRQQIDPTMKYNIRYRNALLSQNYIVFLGVLLLMFFLR